MKRDYKKPTVLVVMIQQHCHLLTGSGVRGVSGLSDDFYVSDESGDGSDAY